MNGSNVPKQPTIPPMPKTNIKKRSQVDRLTIASLLLASVWDEMINGNVDSDTLQIAVNCQISINRIVWMLNRRADNGQFD